MAKKAEQAASVAEENSATDQVMNAENVQDLHTDPFADAEDLDWSDAETVESSRDFDEFLSLAQGESYTGKFVKPLERENDDPLFVFEDYPSKGYRNCRAINQYSSLRPVFTGVTPDDNVVYRITLHRIVDIKGGKTWKDFRVQKLNLKK